jgi:ERCC4-type nuclease
MKLKPIYIHGSNLKPFKKFPDGFVLIQDTREQRPLFNSPPEGLKIVTDTLLKGDYSIRGFEDKFCIERKQVSDFYSYIGKERERTIKKMKEFLDMQFAGLVIEASEANILNGFQMSRVSPETARQAIVSFEVRYGVHVYYSKSRHNIRRWVLDRAIKFYKVRRETR